ncbi:hypothetical protein LCGC14_0779030 [marine sediment metagenome]|uniref:Uncharacterized protein n=1 Tax=marine sediment metagenome TaxID=412755 RepID=A0A0F9Q0A9_9ZZZZ
MATEQTRQVLEDISVAIADAEAQLPTARELVDLMRSANEDTTESQALLNEIDARIKQWKRVIARAGVSTLPTPTPKKA